MGHRRATAIATAAAFAAVLAAAFQAPAAGAQIACWRQVLFAWSKGVVGNGYPIRCYESALAHMPEDMRVYSSAQDDVQRAMLAAIRAQGRPTDRRPAAAAGASRAAAAAGDPASAEHTRGVPTPLLVLCGILVALAAAGCFLPVRRALRRSRN